MEISFQCRDNTNIRKSLRSSIFSKVDKCDPLQDFREEIGEECDSR